MVSHLNYKKEDYFYWAVFTLCCNVFESQFPLKTWAVTEAQLRWRLFQSSGCLRQKPTHRWLNGDVMNLCAFVIFF